MDSSKSHSSNDSSAFIKSIFNRLNLETTFQNEFFLDYLENERYDSSFGNAINSLFEGREEDAQKLNEYILMSDNHTSILKSR